MLLTNEDIDEILESIWCGKETGSVKRKDLLNIVTPKVTEEIIDHLIDKDYIFQVNEEINLTQKGEEIARKLIRAHRLAERLFKDVMVIDEEPMEETACSLEHCLSHEALDAICTLLGHPRECPHGRHIPEGACCKRAEHNIQPVIMPLNKLKSGESGRVAYVSTKHHARLDRLTDLGITPGEVVKVHQTFPAFVLKVGETDIAIDTAVLDDVYVRKNNGK
ncbi:MAG: metal-dependent transcriptional regulator [Deltaproteobacteria bacterium]|nr:metal-dependent transcriptional regulator [Deltaproteobacteria bacterium]